MDLSVNQEVIGVQQRYETEYGSHAFKLQEAFKETDITGNNNFFNSSKTETSSDHPHDSNPPFQVNCSNDKDLEVDSSLFSYSSFKKAMDLRIHNRTVDGGRTIFDDAEYFARNCCYKLLPITFEHVDESIIHTEHNYSLFSLDSESELEEDCSRTMDYSQIREKNYKKRRTKYRESSEREEVDVEEHCERGPSPGGGHSGDWSRQQQQELNQSPSRLEQESASLGQPLDLSAAPAVQEEKTEPLSIGEESGQPDSDKENVSGERGGIRVTITRPDEKESYQPCDLFLNDIARLVPWLIDKDCLEVDILDRTCEREEEFRKHRLYYVIAESTWRSFQSTNERVILTNDQSLGQPVRRLEKGERPSYLVFDQFSLAKCLAEYCQEIGGCFEYTCVEEGGERGSVEDKWTQAMVEGVGEEKGEARSMVEAEEEVESRLEKRTVREEGEEKMEEEEEEEEEKKKEEAEKKSSCEVEEGKEEAKIEGEDRQMEEDDGIDAEGVRKEAEEEERKVEEEVEERKEVREKVGVKKIAVDAGVKRVEKSRKQNGLPKKASKAVKAAVDLPRAEKEAATPSDSGGEEPRDEVPASKTARVEKAKGRKTLKSRGSKQRKQPPAQPKPKNPVITTRAKSTSEFETSQKSDKRVSTKEGRKRRDPSPPRPEPPSKRKRTPKPEDVARSRRSAPLPQRGEPSTEKTSTRKRPDRKGSENQKEAGTGGRRRRRRRRRKRAVAAEVKENVQAVGRSLRSGATTVPDKGKPESSRKVRKR